MSTETTVFRSNRTQAVRLPKAVAFPEAVTHVTITTVGTSRLVTPAVPTWRDWFDRTEAVTDDFMAEGRDQGADVERVHL
ncbi:MAG: antitoxin [Micrococcales bacterium]|nr:antitoxin [Micrococcales bacterium]